ncbi:MAG: HDOD domain-containing protein [Deltaproteobacteria bacterium]|nr:HDOD domain-containing protein [Deltaproteobacteria bacterium]
MSSVDLKIMRGKVENINALPTIPSTLKRLSVLIEKPKITLDEISRFVANDPALATKVLKMVNSAIYGFPGRISSVSHAIMLLGLNVVKGLLLGVSVFEIMQKSMLGLWDHSVGCAVVARLIAVKKGLKEPDEVSVAGLLHDIGKVILLLEFSKEYESAMEDAQTQGVIISEAEKDHFAEGHANVGAWLAEKWCFPRNLIEVMGNHHRPQLSRIAQTETAIVHLSDIIIRARGVGFAGDNSLPVINAAAFEMLKLTEADIKEILKEMENSLEETEDISQA